jgi:hypothetical protein
VDHDRGVLRGDTQPFEDCLGLAILVDVDPLVGNAVPADELADPARVGREPRSEDPQSGAHAQVQRPAGDECAQDQVAEVRVVGHGVLEPLDRDIENFHVLLCDGGQVHALAGQEREVAQKTPRSVHRNRAQPLFGLLDDSDLAGQHHEEVTFPVTLAEEGALRRHLTSGAEPAEQRDLLGSEARVGAVDVGRLGMIGGHRLRRIARRHSTISSPLRARESGRPHDRSSQRGHGRDAWATSRSTPPGRR